MRVAAHRFSFIPTSLRIVDAFVTRDLRAIARRRTPRLDLPERDRVRCAIIFYADLFRAHDIAACCKLPMARLVREATRAGLPSRRMREEIGLLSLVDVCQAVERGATLADIHEQYGISWGAALNVMVLMKRNHPPLPKVAVEPLVLLHRCHNCLGLSRHATACLICGSAW